MHTSPLAQPGTGDGGGMNVYVRQLSAALARAGVNCEVFTRAWSPHLPATVRVEPGFRVHHIPAGPLAEVPKEALPDLVPAFTEGVLGRLDRVSGSLHVHLQRNDDPAARHACSHRRKPPPHGPLVADEQPPGPPARDADAARGFVFYAKRQGFARR